MRRARAELEKQRAAVVDDLAQRRRAWTARVRARTRTFVSRPIDLVLPFAAGVVVASVARPHVRRATEEAGERRRSSVLARFGRIGAAIVGREVLRTAVGSLTSAAETGHAADDVADAATL